jgi:apolipoprotein N-acyltransferase
MTESGLCKYKDIFGAPGTGAHSLKIGGIALIDTLLVFIFAYFLSRWLDRSYWLMLGWLFLLGIVSHRLFCVRTTVDKYLFPGAK